MYKARKMLPHEVAKYRSKATHAFCVEHESGRLAAVNMTWCGACAEARALAEQEACALARERNAELETA